MTLIAKKRVPKLSALLKLTNQKKQNKLLDDLILLDDDLMSKVFDENIPATELLLRIILERDDIKVISVKGQYDMKNPLHNGRSIRLDIHACDSKGKHYDIEVQRSNEGASLKRARFNSSMLDTRMLKSKQEFKELKDSYVIFITESDKLKGGLPIYEIDRCIRQTKQFINDGSHIIYVNASYKGDDAIGKLIQDFHCKKADDIHYKELADGVRHFKETTEGRENMCDAVKKYAQEYAEAYAEEYAGKRTKKYRKKLEKLKKRNEIALKKANNEHISAMYKVVKNAMKVYKLTADQAMQTLEVQEADQKILKSMLA